MPKKELLEGITLTGHTDIFKPTVKSFAVADGESIVEIALGELFPPEVLCCKGSLKKLYYYKHSSRPSVAIRARLKAA